MPCRKENYILLEQSVTVDSKEVDALVTKIGEALQLHSSAGANSQKTLSSCLHHSHSSSGDKHTCTSTKHSYSASHTRTSSNTKHGCCIRLRNRGLRSRASPYSIPGDYSDQDWDSLRAWNRKKIDVSSQEDDPHQLLQELILSGNLIKEAVRRLQLSTADRADLCKPADSLQC
ncbi:glycogen synthase kinase binding protein [Lepisosteus oculatus]|uniref:Glycogen synthase kinase binding protein n=1 Tax=Lepisosteus oculatus TaxID=7918 RepID=W5NP72_LEPOC|nr:PREDICTED: GSK-3-binding protein FRAT2 [Lepisosteus oculatus]